MSAGETIRRKIFRSEAYGQGLKNRKRENTDKRTNAKENIRKNTRES